MGILKFWGKIKEALVLYKNNFAIFFLWYACYFLTESIDSRYSVVLYVLSIVLLLIIFYALIKFILCILDNKKFDIFSTPFFHLLKEWLNFIGTLLSFCLISFIPLICIVASVLFFSQTILAIANFQIFLIVAVIFSVLWMFFFYVRFGFACFISIDKNIGIIKSFKKSWKITNGKFWNIFYNYFLILCIFLILFMITIPIVTLLHGIVVWILIQIIMSVIFTPIALMLVIMIYRNFVSYHKGNENVEIKEEKNEAKLEVEEKKEEAVTEDGRIIKKAEIINE